MPQSPGGNQSTGETPSALYVFSFFLRSWTVGSVAAKTIVALLEFLHSQYLAAYNPRRHIDLSRPLIGPLETVGRTLEYRHKTKGRMLDESDSILPSQRFSLEYLICI